MKNSSYGYHGEAHTYDNKQYLRARYYDVHSENFIQEDSYRGTLSDVASRNRYNYAQNNPYKYSDPSGHLNMDGGNSTTSGRGFETWANGTICLFNGKSYTGRYNGVEYKDGIVLTGICSKDNKYYNLGYLYNGTRNGYIYKNGVIIGRTEEKYTPITETHTNYQIKDSVVTATFTPTKISVSAPILDVSELTTAAKVKVKDTAKALGVPEYILKQFLQADLDKTKFMQGLSMSDRVIGLCNAYLGIAKKNNSDYERMTPSQKNAADKNAAIVKENAGKLHMEFVKQCGTWGAPVFRENNGKLYAYIEKDIGYATGYTYMDVAYFATATETKSEVIYTRRYIQDDRVDFYVELTKSVEFFSRDVYQVVVCLTKLATIWGNIGEIESSKRIEEAVNNTVPNVSLEGYYQDLNGTWHRPNGQFASNAEVGAILNGLGVNKMNLWKFPGYESDN